ncbi:MAG: nitroreductase family protein [Prevotellaceae bacterium]|nr:nitroreductase family protein [Prevotellaceae bacterium]MDO4931113.1 nitroreductase family protein [Prevotellaceae bacterium]
MKRVLYSIIGLMALTSCSAQTETATGCSDREVVEKVIMTRRSIRRYTDRTVSRDTLNDILKCGINAPNGQNRQAYEVRVVDSPKLLAEISEAVRKDNPGVSSRNNAGNIFAGATCVVFIANDTSYDVSQIDCGLLGENIMLAAWSRGIGSCCMAHPVRLMKESGSCVPYMERLGFSKGYNLLYCIAMGYPGETPKAKPRKDGMIRFVE